MSVTVHGTSGITFNDNTTQATSPFAGGLGFRNRIINGDMRIDQRNNGAAVTVNSGTDFFPVDRFLAVGTSSDGVFTVQRSTVAPSGFTNSLLATVTTADASIGTLEQYYVSQIIEGFNVADLAWGTSNAQAVALSFVARSSVTGTYGGSVRNSATDRSYPFTFTINSANTFETKTVTIPGDTSGTWLTNNGVGMHIIWSLGMGSSRVAAAGSWSSGNFKSASGATQWISTNGATFYITGVQLEKGSTATEFDRRPYGTELALCQRYFQVISSGLIGCFANTTTYTGTYVNPVVMRAAPTASVTAPIRLSDIYSSSYTQSSGAITVGSNYEDSGQYELTNFSGGTAGRFALQYTAGIAGKIRLSAEL